MKRYIPNPYKCLALCLCIVLHALGAPAQQEDSKGTDFLLSFLPNIHLVDITKDSLYIFLVAEEESAVSIEYYARLDNFDYRHYSEHIIIPPGIHTFRLPAARTDSNNRIVEEFELRGYNYDYTSLHYERRQNGSPARQVFHIHSDKEITVYGLNHATRTSDAFLALPESVLGREYRILAYPTDERSRRDSPRDLNGTSASQAAVIAAHNNTVVYINPGTALHSTGNAQALEVILQRGEVYLIQAMPDTADAGTRPDLSGTQISADKPIAVFAGHQMATVPITKPGSTFDVTRDHLVEQLLPLEYWGKNAFVTPMPLPASATRHGYDLYRVLAALNNTRVLINGVQKYLNAGEFFEAPIEQVLEILADKPIQVGQYKKTSRDSGSFKLSDPFFLLLPPREQYLDSYTFIAPDLETSLPAPCTNYNIAPL